MASEAPSVVVLLPVFNDWSSLSLLIPRVASHLSQATSRFAILIVDDCSTNEASLPPEEATAAADWVRVVRLRRNLGHQRAIAIGLSYIDEHVDCDAVIIMDADGEDRPEDLGPLLRRFRDERAGRIVFAERRRRAERPLFAVLYRCYQLLHRVLTGASVRVGNFSVVPRRQVSSLVVVSELWVHFAAAAVRSRQPLCMVGTERGRRLDGRSQMDFVSLVVHGLSAISVYSDVVYTRLIMAAAGLMAVALAAMAAVTGVRLFTTMAVPGWATFSLGLLLIVLLQAVIFIVSLTFLMLGTRQHSTIVPLRDYSYYVDEVLPRTGSASPP
jgi:glycosyltransferase involved in cell wall biosynthesis